MGEKLRAEPFLDGQGLRVVLDAPKGNVLDAAMMAELGALLDELRGRPGLKLLAFAGAGGHFSFGASVPEHLGERAAPMLAAFHGIFRRLAELAVPTAAAVRGRCLGGGMELATFCHRVVAHPGAVFAQPEIQLAVLAPIASIVLPLRAGQAVADDLLLTGRSVTAAEALSLRLCDEVAEDPEAALEAWARREIAPRSATSLRFAARASRRRLDRALAEELPAIERLYLDELMATADATEGLQAFLERRPPRWTHG